MRIINKSKHIARKKYICDKCNNIIYKDNEYLRVTKIKNGKWKHEKYHIKCYKIKKKNIWTMIKNFFKRRKVMRNKKTLIFIYGLIAGYLFCMLDYYIVIRNLKRRK